MIRFAVPLLGLALALTACKGSDKPSQGAQAAGEVLPGSASDAMIPLDTVRSQPPLAPPPTASAKPGGGKAGDVDADAAATEAGSEEAPAIAVPPASPAPPAAD